MKKQFYDHLISLETLEVELGKIEASDEEKKHLKSLAEENIHISIMERVLSELSSEDKKTFLKHVHHEEHDKVWELLQTKTTDIEQKIIASANDLIEELKKDVSELKKNN